MSRRLLVISWDMPPLSGPRAVQVSRTLKQLVPLGWESWVVCFSARSARYNQDEELAAKLRAPHGVTLVPVRSLEERLPIRLLWRVIPPLKLLPDEKWVWIADAARAARRLAAERRYDVLVSFAQPWSDHLIGRRVHRATGLPWVAHFSDPWIDSPYLKGAAWQRRIWRRMEADVVREADALVFVTQQTADRVMRKYPEDWLRKVHVLPHGFDPSDRRPDDDRSDEAGRPLTLVYTGRFYDGLRSPDTMMHALALLAERRPLSRELRVTFVGPPIPAHRLLAQRLGLDGVVEFTGRLPWAESTRRAAAADALLLIDAPAADSLFLPSKLVDYLPLGKPILGLTPSQGAAADLVRRLGYDVIPPDDVPAIALAVESLIVRHQGGGLGASAVHAAASRAYDIRQTALQFADILDRCAS